MHQKYACWSVMSLCNCGIRECCVYCSECRRIWSVGLFCVVLLCVCGQLGHTSRAGEDKGRGLYRFMNETSHHGNHWERPRAKTSWEIRKKDGMVERETERTRERQRERERGGVFLCVRETERKRERGVCVCVCERERERDREKERERVVCVYGVCERETEMRQPFTTMKYLFLPAWAKFI